MMVFIFGCIGESEEDFINEQNSTSNSSGKIFTAHEWGVALYCDSSNSNYFTSRPKMRVLVKQPVIYFYNSPEEFKVRAEMDSINETYPEGGRNKFSVKWNVTNGGAMSANAMGINKGADLMPLDEVLKKLVNNESDLLEVDGKQTSFLYYEGETDWEEDSYFKGDYFYNDNGFDIYDVLVIKYDGSIANGKPVVSYFAVIEGGDRVGLDYNLTADEAQALLRKSLDGIGMKRMEKENFLALWNDSIFFPNNTGFLQVFYRIPQSRASMFSEVDISPEPKVFNRYFFVLKEFS